MILLTWLFLPPALLVLTCGFVFQNIYLARGWSFVIAWSASLLGAVIGGTLAFCRAPRLSRDLLTVVRERYPILNAVDSALITSPLRVMMLLRLNPFLPFGVLNYDFAMKGVDMGLFVVSMLPVAQWYLLLTCVGAGLSNIYNGYSSIPYAIGAVCGALVMMIVWKFAKNELQDEVQNEMALYQKGKALLDEEMTTVTDGTSIDGRTLATTKQSWFKRFLAKIKHSKKSQSKTSSKSVSSGDKSQSGSEKSVTVVESTNTHIVEDSDLSGADYVRTQILGQDNASDKSNSVYRGTLNATEVMLDDFS
eukprot:CAMPEP_0201708782 /NCGR_PEP_ID=MMETSP0578-20130828/56707_1 /ASSEMBLY_ACC=CAM_ASM_000663 /TAXON_ID=267565 /ORGANISM="Skeletonema grethea, Strain CCMP 1804" /LENGTH=306 /DNA_ID=CAMNT_0048197681 /DNA_START=271 /DNA_END=1191 /DNA_ORIENTATION=+